MREKVCFITLSRSDYTSLRPVIRAAVASPDLSATIVAGGSHLLQRFGRSINQVEQDLGKLDHIIDFLEESDDHEEDIARAYGIAFQKFVELFREHRPEAIFILGDRWEIAAVASAASILRIPIFHHSGGDITQGSMDNQTRYVISMLSHIHLVGLESHRQRLLAMGEESWRVTCVGEPALLELHTAAQGDVLTIPGVPVDKPYALATYHPSSFDNLSFSQQVEFFISVLDMIDIEIVLTAPNPDPGSRTFYQTLKDYAAGKDHVHFFENLGADNYHAAMQYADFMIGNSSSGIWEAPSFGLPVINIGNRQKDRERGQNVVDVAVIQDEVKHALENIQKIRKRDEVREKRNPYVKEDCLALILDSIRQAGSDDRLLNKVFVDPLL